MTQALRQRLFDEIDSWVLIDPHTHIDPHAPSAKNLADLLGYHYYTELAHSAGLDKQRIEEPNLDPREKTRRIVEALGPLENTVQYGWLIDIAREFFGFQHDRLTTDNWQPLYETVQSRTKEAGWPAEVLQRSRIEAVFLTNHFDDPLEGFDTRLYIPCLRTDELVFHLAHSGVRRRLEQATGIAVGGASTLRVAIGKLFAHFTAHGARACAISLPPDFSPSAISPAVAEAAVSAVFAGGDAAPPQRRRELSHWVFWTLAEYCADYRLPFDLMIGVNRGVYAGGVYQGQDLYDSRVSLIQYRELFNAFARVIFPISVLASVTSQELASYSWIFPNVVTNGHWWYSNTPTFIEHDAAARLEAVPATKQIAYYSDMYKLEFALPKFRMYKRILAKILSERFVIDRGWSEQRAIALARRVLRDNVEQVFAAR